VVQGVHKIVSQQKSNYNRRKLRTQKVNKESIKSLLVSIILRDSNQNEIAKFTLSKHNLSLEVCI